MHDILCFEPDDKNFGLLQKNILSHNLKNIDAKKEAVWVEDCWLYFKQEGNMNSKIENIESANTTKIKASRLKDFLNKKVDFLKLDIEGAEYQVLKDIQGNLNFVTNLFIEYHGTFSQNHELLEIFKIITQSGFTFYIKEAANNYHHPFLRSERPLDYDVQLNIFCLKNFAF